MDGKESKGSPIFLPRKENSSSVEAKDSGLSLKSYPEVKLEKSAPDTESRNVTHLNPEVKNSLDKGKVKLMRTLRSSLFLKIRKYREQETLNL